MSGQDPTMMHSADTFEAVNDTLVPPLFEVSSVQQGMSAVADGIDTVQKAMPTYSDWIFIYLLVLLGLFAWIRLYYRSILTQTLQASTNFQMASRMFKDNSLLQSQLDKILYGYYFLCTALLLYVIEGKLNLKPYGLQEVSLYLFNLALLVALFFSRIVLVILTGFLFNRTIIFREYLYNTFIFNKILSLSILPLLLFVLYTEGIVQEVLFWITLAIVAAVLVMRIYRGFIFSFKKDVLIFYMFLYLCALELVPLVLLYRWLEGIL